MEANERSGSRSTETQDSATQVGVSRRFLLFCGASDQGVGTRMSDRI